MNLSDAEKMKPDDVLSIDVNMTFDDAERIALTNCEDGQFFDISNKGKTIKISGSYTREQITAIMWLMHFKNEVEK